jgi:hypothetical protein
MHPKIYDNDLSSAFILLLFRMKENILYENILQSRKTAADQFVNFILGRCYLYTIFSDWLVAS